MVIKAIIIDDQQDAIDVLKFDLLDLFPRDIQIIGESNTIEEGVIIFKEFKPDLIFLDIDLKEGTGFDFLERIIELEHNKYNVIFTTAFNQFAIKAIKFSAFDYLLKPIDIIELEKTVNRFKEEFEQKNKYTRPSLDVLINNAKTIDLLNRKIAIPTQDQVHFVLLSNILYCESSQNYTKFYLLEGKDILVAKTMKEYELLLDEYGFVRAHQRFVVNSKYVISLLKEDGGVLLMTNNVKIPVSRRKRDLVLKRLSKF